MDTKKRVDFRLNQDLIDKIDRIARAYGLTRTGALEYLVNQGFDTEREKQGLWQKMLEKQVKSW